MTRPRKPLRDYEIILVIGAFLILGFATLMLWLQMVPVERFTTMGMVRPAVAATDP